MICIMRLFAIALLLPQCVVHSDCFKSDHHLLAVNAFFFSICTEKITKRLNGINDQLTKLCKCAFVKYVFRKKKACIVSLQLIIF